MAFSDYIVYVDESGDHGLANVNPQSPVFVLAFCIFQKTAYQTAAVPAVQGLKFAFWGHDGIILHSHEIRTRRGDFRILNDRDLRSRFMERVNEMIELMPFMLISSVIDKKQLQERYSSPANPYSIGLAFCIERLHYFLAEHGQLDAQTFLMVECRGKKEDRELELEFRRLCAGGTYAGDIRNLEIRFMDKKHNSTGLQIADLVAYPIGRHIVRPDQPNRAFEIVQRKFRRNGRGRIDGYGLKVFP